MVSCGTQDLAAPAQTRKRDHENTPRAAEMFAASLNRFKKALTSHLSGDAAYDHWTPEEVQKLTEAISEKSAWLDGNMSRVRATPKTKEVPVKAAAFLSEQQVKHMSLNLLYENGHLVLPIRFLSRRLRAV